MIQVTQLWVKMISKEGTGHHQNLEFPANMPEPRGHGFIMRAKVNADHA